MNGYERSGALPGVWVSRLIGWTSLVTVIAALNYASRAAAKSSDRNELYHVSTAVGAFVQYAIMLAIVVFIARGSDRRAVLGWQSPKSWARALGLAALALGLIYAVAALLDLVLHASKEQGLTPTGWQSQHAAAFALNFVAIAIAAPFVEETTFRGLGVSLFARYGDVVAALVTGLAFGLAHGLVRGLPILVFFGFVLAILRRRTGSVYPGMLVHCAFNSIALMAAVT